ncbi:MAG: helix-turn-helix domain-containing protein [Bacteroidales bacterium]
MKKSSLNPVVDQNQDFVVIKKIKTGKESSKPIDHYHHHKAIQIVLIEKGNAGFVVNNVLYEVDSNSVIVLGSELPHGIVHVSDDIEATLIHIAFQPLYSWLSLPNLAREKEYIHDACHGFLYSSFTLNEEISVLSDALISANGFEQISIVFQLLNKLYLHPSPQKLLLNYEKHSFMSDTKCQNEVERIYRYLYAYYDKEFSLVKLAELVHVNPTSLCRSFKRKTGFTLFETLHKLRIEKACQLLISTDLTVAQIAFEVGFNSYSAFNNSFRKIKGITPMVYRQQI